MRFGLLLVSLLLLPASAASAVERSPYFTEREDLVFDLEEIDYDSDWQPVDSPIQVRFVVHSGNSVYVGMDGDGTYNWDAGQIYFEGYDDGGAFDIDIGVDIQSQIRFDILGNQWESDELQLLAWGIFETVLFDPYLLAGSPYRPAYIETEIPPETVLDIPLGIDLVIASGSFEFAVGAQVYAELEGTAITAETESETVIVDAWDLAVSLGADPSSPLEVWATLETYLYFEVTFLLYPSVVLTVLGNDYTLAEIEIPIETPPSEDNWFFEPVLLTFEPPPEPTEPTVQGEPGTGGSASTTFSGCGCTSVTGARGSALGLLLLIALLRLRRPARRS